MDKNKHAFNCMQVLTPLSIVYSNIHAARLIPGAIPSISVLNWQTLQAQKYFPFMLYIQCLMKFEAAHF